MSSLTRREKDNLEQYLDMKSGYVLDFNNKSFAKFFMDVVGKDIYSDDYNNNGDSKANRLRTFWSVEPDHVVGRLLIALIERKTQQTFDENLMREYSQIANRLLRTVSQVESLKEIHSIRDSHHLSEIIRRIETTLHTDPSAAIGGAKELVEAVCKTILDARGITIPKDEEFSKLTKRTFNELQLVPDNITNHTLGRKQTKQIIGNLGALCNSLAQIRNHYGTGHGHAANTVGLDIRHARLVVGAASTLVLFLYDTHLEQQ